MTKKILFIILLFIIVLILIFIGVYYSKNLLNLFIRTNMTNENIEYKNSSFGWSIKYPSNVKITKSDSEDVVVLKNDNPKYLLEVQVFPKKFFMDLGDKSDDINSIADARLNEIKTLVNNMKLLDSGLMNFKDFSAVRAIYSFQNKNDAQKLEADEIFFINKDNVFELSVIYDEGADIWSSGLTDIINSLQFSK